MELSEFISVIRKWFWIVLPAVLLVTGYTLFTGLKGDATYRADTIVVVGLSEMVSPGGGSGNISYNAARIGATYEELITTEPVMNGALEIAGLDWDPMTLAVRISVELPKDTTVLKIGVIDSDSELAERLADAVAESFSNYIRDVGAATNEGALKSIDEELLTNEKEIAALSAVGSDQNASQIKSLQQAQGVLLERQANLMENKNKMGDVTVLQPASAVQTVGIQWQQRTIIAFFISLVAGIALAFVAEAISKARKSQA